MVNGGIISHYSNVSENHFPNKTIFNRFLSTMDTYGNEFLIFFTVGPSFGHSLLFLFVHSTSDGGQVDLWYANKIKLSFDLKKTEP